MHTLCVCIDTIDTPSLACGIVVSGGSLFHPAGIVENQRSAAIKAKADALNEYYYPVEVDASLSLDKKIPLMEAWYKGINDLLVESGVRREDIAPSVAAANVAIREGVASIFKFAEATGTPLLVFSAGIGDVVREVIHQKVGPLPRKSAIVSNWMNFNEDGKLVSWSTPLIHMFNKNDSHLRASPIYPDLSARPNVVLIGDSLGDTTMADGAPHDTVLKIGLLNDQVSAQLDNYLRVFDVVITHDGSLEWVADWLFSFPHD